MKKTNTAKNRTPKTRRIHALTPSFCEFKTPAAVVAIFKSEIVKAWFVNSTTKKLTMLNRPKIPVDIR